MKHIPVLTFCLALQISGIGLAKDIAKPEDLLLSSKWRWHNAAPLKDFNEIIIFNRDGKGISTEGTPLTWWSTKDSSIHFRFSTYQEIEIRFEKDSVDRFTGFRVVDGTAAGWGERILEPSKSTLILTSIQTDGSLPRIQVIKDQGPNATEWALTPLDEVIPADIRQNLALLREDLLDEGKKAAKSSPEAYKLASDYCDKILTALDQRDLARVNAGYAAAQADANKRISTQALDARRNHQMSWPQFSREESQRAALRANESDKADVKKQRLKVEWTNRAVQMRSYLDGLYRRLREAMR
jgi:hypothetical protein